MPTTLTTVSENTKALVTQIVSADIVKIHGNFLIMPNLWIKGTSLPEIIETLCDKEDHEVVLKIGKTQFNWWEIREESERVGNYAWKINGIEVSFYTLQPA